MEKIIGILGGMGPLATADLFSKIVLLTDAGSDNEHIRTIIDSNSHIPDRTEAILNGGRDPVPDMLESARLLERAGCDVIIIPCNTAHFFIGRLQEQISVPFIDMIRETAKKLQSDGIRTAGLLATDGTCQTGIYEKALADAGIAMLRPEPDDQRIVMDTIYKVKAQNSDIPVERLRQIAAKFKQRGAQGIILGCTELPIVFQNIETVLPKYDPTLILAQCAVRFAGKKVRA